ncbi:hypothetical protein KKE03_03720, partial [Patescibacteria group bacterium]|nr:hypothetical protein [Patescibacteria group bacterium]
ARPGTVLNDPKLELSAQYYQELPPEMTAAQQTGQAPTGAATGTADIPAGLPSMPTAPRISIPRFTRTSKEITPITTTPEPTPPKPQLVTATATGAIKEAGKPAELVKASRLGTVEESSFFKPEPVVASKSGVVSEAGDSSKLVTTDRMGNIKAPGAETPQRFNFSSVKASFSSGFKNVQNFASRANPFLKTNLGRITNSLKGMVGGLGGGIGGAMRSGLGVTAPTLGRMGNSVLGGIQTISRPGGIGGLGGGVTKGLKSPNKVIFIGLGVFLLVVLLMGLTGALTGTPQTGEAAPISGGGEGPPPDSGLDPTIATDCPIPGGTITCGSQSTPIQTADGLCGHCAVGYTFMSNCTPDKESWGTKFALDIAATPLQPVILPKINGHIIKWTHISDKPGGSGYIQTYAGEDTETQEKYLIQFHHTETYSGNPGLHLSGERGANACRNCEENHIHVQLRNPASLNWLDAAQYFCRP